MAPSAFSAVLLLAVIAGASYWVLQDARRRVQDHRPVVAILFGLSIEQPETWAALSLVVCFVFIPMYLVARGAQT